MFDVLNLYAESQPSVNPVISIITPTWNTKPAWFSDLAISILEQRFLDWEWCIVDDCSSDVRFKEILNELRNLPNVKVEELTFPQGISRVTNRALELASGEFVCFVDHDDVLARDALLRCVQALLNQHDAVYTDSDKIDELLNDSEPFFKPGWSPEFFRGVMFVGHLLAVRRDLALTVGGFDPGFDGVQDFEFFLRYSEATNRIAHIPEVLYHWRAVHGSVAAAIDAKGDLGKLQQQAVRAQLQRLHLQAGAERGDYPHRVKIVPFRRSTEPRVSVIIPTKDSPDILRKCLHNLFARTTYSNFEVLCVDNDTSDPIALEELRNAPVQHILMPGKFNFSAANNMARPFASGDYLVFMNNDVEVVTPDWIEQMLYHAEQDEVGAVGALLLYANQTIQHAGVILGCRGIADHVSRGAPADSDGYAGSVSCAREVSAVTAACMMMKRDLFDEVLGFDEHFFTAYQDVDLCMKIRAKGKRIIYTPSARLIHHESLSRGTYYDMVDHFLLLDTWQTEFAAGDPYYNPNFDLAGCNYELSKPASLVVSA